ncbi:MAG: hypothetical protein ABIH99_02400 [Candidatus Micrarchaeota archaeon]
MDKYIMKRIEAYCRENSIEFSDRLTKTAEVLSRILEHSSLADKKKVMDHWQTKEDSIRLAYRIMGEGLMLENNDVKRAKELHEELTKAAEKLKRADPEAYESVRRTFAEADKNLRAILDRSR